MHLYQYWLVVENNHQINKYRCNIGTQLERAYDHCYVSLLKHTCFFTSSYALLLTSKQHRHSFPEGRVFSDVNKRIDTTVEEHHNYCCLVYMTKGRYLTNHIHEDVHLLGNPTHKKGHSDNGEGLDDVSRCFVVNRWFGIRNVRSCRLNWFHDTCVTWGWRWRHLINNWQCHTLSFACGIAGYISGCDFNVAIAQDLYNAAVRYAVDNNGQDQSDDDLQSSEHSCDKPRWSEEHHHTPSSEYSRCWDDVSTRVDKAKQPDESHHSIWSSLREPYFIRHWMYYGQVALNGDRHQI